MRTSARSARANRRGYAILQTSATAASNGNATPAIPQWVVLSSSTALVTTSSVAIAPPTAVSRSNSPGTGSEERMGASSFLTQPPPEIVERPRARDIRHLVEVVRRRRRGRVPLERVGLPRVVPDAWRSPRFEHVPEKEQEPDPHDPGADRGGQVEGLPVLVHVRVDAARHPLEAEEVLREERHVEADEHEPEVPLADRVVEHPPEHLRDRKSVV